MGQTEISVVSQLLGLEIQDLVVCLTHKETVSYKFEYLLHLILKFKSNQDFELH